MLLTIYYFVCALSVGVLSGPLPAQAASLSWPGDRAVKDSTYTLSNERATLTVSQAGELVQLYDHGSEHTFPLQGSTRIEGLFAHTATVQPTGKGLRITTALYDSLGDRSCTLVKMVEPTENSFRVTIHVQGHDYAWSAPIVTRFMTGKDDATRFWTAWALGDEADESVYSLDGDTHEENAASAPLWHDPLLPRSFENLQLVYGSQRSDRFRKGFSLPLATVIYPEQQRSVNVVLSPEDTLVKLHLETTAAGNIIFSRHNHRIGPDRPVFFTYDLFTAEADWRPALKWLTQRYPRYFEPSVARVHAMAGPSSYSGYNDALDTALLRHIGYGFNWFAVRGWPYLGMFLPPVADDETWMSWSGFGSGTATTGKVTSFDSFGRHYQKMHERGFHLLAYFNLTEFGYRIKFPYDSSLMTAGQPLWKESNNLLHQRLRPAILYTEDHRVRFSWNKCVIMDPGHPVYKKYLLEQAQRHIDKTPTFDGICIDRLDWFEHMNYRRDDRITMVGGKKVSAMATSLHDVMKPIADLMHQHDKVIFYNPHITRLDYAQYFDGIFDEFADAGSKINLSSLLALKKPIVGWIHNQAVLEADPDDLIQKFLYLGVYPMAPFPEANHSLEASAWADSVYRDYGLMFRALRGKAWVLEPHAVRVLHGQAKVNIFKTHQGVVVPVMLGRDTRDVEVEISALRHFFPDDPYTGHVVYPGDEAWTPLDITSNRKEQSLTIPLKRGCAMLLFN